MQILADAALLAFADSKDLRFQVVAFGEVVSEHDQAFGPTVCAAERHFDEVDDPG